MNDNQLFLAAIDSLENNFTSLSATIDNLKSQNKALSDSLKILNDSIIKAGVKTDFYSDQLNSQLFWFSLILALIGLFSWKSFLTPLISRLQTIETETIPNNIQQIKDDLTNKIEKFENDYQGLHDRTSEAISWGLRASRYFYQKEEKWAVAILFAMRHIDLYFIDDIIDYQMDSFLKEVKSVYDLLEDNKDNINNFLGFEDEILKIINKVKIEESSPEINDLGFKISEIFHSIIKQPETGLEADPHEDPSK